MNSLKEATAANHQRAESTELVKLIFQRTITPQQYSGLLANQLIYYSQMEQFTEVFGSRSALKRVDAIVRDLAELESECWIVSPLSYQYSDYLSELPAQQLWAHIYVHYLGDMMGGKMLKRCVPGSGTRFDFLEPAVLISDIRMNVSVADATEANTAFEWTIKIYDDLYQRLRTAS
jgi:heme oxygenase